MVQLAVLDRTRTAPPGSPAGGDRHIVASGATGLWAGWDLNIAYWVDGAWTRLVPRPGWLAWIAAEGILASWTGSAWQALGAPENLSDAVFSLMSDTDPTKKALFNLSGLSTGTTRTYTEQQIVLLGSPARSTFFKWKKEGGRSPRRYPRANFARVQHLQVSEHSVPGP